MASFPFTKLPAELRNRIYHNVLVRGEPIRLQVNGDYEEERAVLGLLSTSRQILEEARDIYYSQNYLRLWDADDEWEKPLSWAGAMDRNNTARMPYLSIVIDPKCGNLSCKIRDCYLEISADLTTGQAVIQTKLDLSQPCEYLQGNMDRLAELSYRTRRNHDGKPSLKELVIDLRSFCVDNIGERCEIGAELV